MIKNIIFDIGKVLFDYDPHTIVTTLLPQCKTPDFYVEHLHNSQVWQDLDAGIITDNTAAKWVASREPNTPLQRDIIKNVHYIISQFHQLLPPIMPMLNALETRLSTHRVFLLSNFQDRPFDRLCKRYPLLTKVDGAIVSAKENCMKPDAAIYQLLLNRYSLQAEECVFIDDKSDNIQMAKEMGIHGICHDHYSRTLTQLATYI